MRWSRSTQITTSDLKDDTALSSSDKNVICGCMTCSMTDLVGLVALVAVTTGLLVYSLKRDYEKRISIHTSRSSEEGAFTGEGENSPLPS